MWCEGPVSCAMALTVTTLLVILLPSATTLEDELDARESRTLPPAVDALLQRVIDDIGVDFEAERIDLLAETTRIPETDDTEGPRNALDTWSVVWYCGMFAAFTSLFLIMPCSQVLCRAGLLRSDPRLRPRAPLALHGYAATPPPPYKQFAPPAYEDVILDLDFNKTVPDAIEVYVIPLRSGDAVLPPSTQAAA